VSQTPRSDSNGRAWVRSPPLFSAELRGEGGRRGSRTPKGQEAHPFSRRDTAPIAVLPSNFARVAPAGLEPACPRVRAGSSLRLSYGADVAGRTRTCDAPRFRRALYRPSFGHQTWARLDSNQQLPVCKTGAHPIELLARAFRDKDSNLDSHVQSVVSFPLDDPGSPCISVHPSRERSTQQHSVFLMLPSGGRHFSSEPPMSKPLANPSTLDRRPQSCTSAGRRLRGGALEPEPRACREKEQANANAYPPALIQRTRARVFLSQAGPRFDLELLELSITPLSNVVLTKQKGDPLGRPRLTLCG
jgi:hypothetical protein